MKICFKCNQSKDTLEFYKHLGMKDGLLSKCKACCKKDVNDNRLKNYDYYREFDKKRSMLPHRVLARNAYRKTEKGKAAIKKSFDNQSKIKPLARAARIITGNAIRDSRIIKKDCEVCGNIKSQAHHDNYYEPLNVRWLCRKCHDEWHKFNTPQGM